MKKPYIIVIAVFILALIACLVLAVFESPTLTWMVERFCGPIIPASVHVRNLRSRDPDVVMSGLHSLRENKNPIAVPQAIELLQSTNHYIWLNSALYLGACGRQEAAPYLIKALRHTAWRADPEILAGLRAVTGQDFGIDFALWQQWWLSIHPDTDLNWESKLGPSPRLPNTNSK